MAVERHPPSVDALARRLESTLPPPLRIDAARASIAAGRADEVNEFAQSIERSLLRPVINATGVLLHTNLGRAPFQVIADAAYANVELDLESGSRGDRRHHAGSLIARACGAEAAVVVNNGASAILLVLAALARGQDVAVSRGELVEIGGGFRIPDVMSESGANLVEVGTTNRTRPADYAGVAEQVELLMKVHRSNFRISGFTEEASVAQISDLGRPVVVDLGSGLLDSACPWLPGGPPPWLQGEPAVRQTLKAGAALVTFSGDKLLGGPQAGIIAGDATLVDRCARHPLYRALRPGGLLLGALQDLALSYLRRDGMSIPLWRMATAPLEQLRSRAEALGHGDVIECASIMGGGTLPGVEIVSFGIRVDGDITNRLRANRRPVISRMSGGHTILDLRTVDPADDADVGRAVEAAVR